MDKTYIVTVTRGTQIEFFDGMTKKDIENATFEQEDNAEEISRFDTREEALSELVKHKNSAHFFGNSNLIDSEIFRIIEWDIDEDGELESGSPIAFADWAE